MTGSRSRSLPGQRVIKRGVLEKLSTLRTIDASGLGRRILSLLGLEPGQEFALSQCRDGSILIRKELTIEK